MQEPTYDPQRLQTDSAYRYDMIDAFTAYMQSLPNHIEQISYFMRMCKAMAIEPPMLNAGNLVLFDGECWSGYGEGQPVDEQGNKLMSKSWGVSGWGVNNGVDNKATASRLYFTEFYKDRFGSLWGFKIHPLSELKVNYLQRVAASQNPDAFRSSELNNTRRKIKEYQDKITQWANELSVSEQIHQQFRQASQLVEDELNGSDAIEWSLFRRPYTLNPFALLWDITAYKLFLEQPQQVDAQQGKKNGKANSSRSTNDTTQDNARMGVAYFEARIGDIVKRENGKMSAMSNKEIVSEAIELYEKAKKHAFAPTEKSLSRYLKDIGKHLTAKKYGGQLVGQLKRRN